MNCGGSIAVLVPLIPTAVVIGNVLLPAPRPILAAAAVPPINGLMWAPLALAAAVDLPTLFPALV